MAGKEEIIGIFDNENFTQLYLGATPMKASIKDDSQVMSHPLEDGSKVSDHQVFNLIEINIPLILSSDDFVAVYNSIDKAYKANTLFTVQTKVTTYKNMVISSKPREETPNSGIGLNVNFIQFDRATTVKSISPKYPTDGNTTKRGVQNGSTTSEEKRTSVLAGIIQ